jgi:hypothetical protein
MAIGGADAASGPPTPHAASHESGGSDEINVGGLAGVLADPQNPAAHAASHQNGGSDEINVAGLSGLLADAQTPIPTAGVDTTAIHNNVAGEITAVTEKPILGCDDEFLLEDADDSDNKKSVKASNMDAGQLILCAIKGSPGTITAGEAVYISGYNAGLDLPEVELAQADDISTMPAIGLAEGDITNVAKGIVVVAGRVRDVDTSGFSVGDLLYVDPLVAGGLVAGRPDGVGTLIEEVGEVLRSNLNNGVIEVFGSGNVEDLPQLARGFVWTGGTGDTPVETDLEAIGPAAGMWTKLSSGSLVVANDVEMTVLAGQSIDPGTGELPFFMASPGTIPAGDMYVFQAPTGSPPAVGEARYCPVLLPVSGDFDFRVRHNEAAASALKWTWAAFKADVGP